MKIRAMMMATALISTSFTPISLMTAPANAAVPSLSDMQTQCGVLVSDPDGAGTVYQIVTTAGSVDPGSPVGDSSTIVDDETSRVADHSTASSPYGTMQYYGNAGRHGGSVNLFATTGYPGITYAGSTVNQNWDRFQTDTYNFSCQLQHYEVVGSHQEQTSPGTPAVAPDGWYTNPGHPVWESEAINTTICAHNEGKPWGTSYGNCVFHPGPYSEGTPPTYQTVYDYGYVDSGSPVSGSLNNGPYYVDTVQYAAGVKQAHPVTEFDNAPYFGGDAVVCINPGKKGGVWTAKTGWQHPEQCNTTYFNTAPYISGANVFSSNSLPL